MACRCDPPCIEVAWLGIELPYGAHGSGLHILHLLFIYARHMGAWIFYCGAVHRAPLPDPLCPSMVLYESAQQGVSDPHLPGIW